MIARLPIRLRLTIAFTMAMVLLLAAGGAIAYLSVRDGLDESIDESLEARVGELASLAETAPARLPKQSLDPEERFAQLIGADGVLLARSGGPAEPALEDAQLEAALSGRLGFEAEVEGIEGTARVLAAPAGDGRVVVAAQTLEDRDETLSGLIRTLAIGGLLGIGLASLAGYALARSALRPIEAMRAQAESLALEDSRRLPLPAPDDELRRLGTTLNEMLARMRAAHARERRFVADASHELRTPIAVLKAEIEAASRLGGNEPEQTAALAAALEECDRLAQLAEDLLLIARTGESGLELDRDPIATATLLARVRERFSDRARLAGRAVTVADDAGATVDGDARRLTQALSNLLDNALRHGGGEITLGSRREGSAVELYVRDEGPGLPDGLAGREFERFSRGDDARSGGGAGLGLAIVAAIAEAHGGSVRSSPGPSSEFAIRLPLEAA